MSADRPSAAAGQALAVFLGWLLVVVGVLIGGLGGLCTLVMLSDGSREARAYAAIGVVPVVIGGAILMAGVLVLRDQRRRSRAWQPNMEDLAHLSDGTPPPRDAAGRKDTADDR